MRFLPPALPLLFILWTNPAAADGCPVHVVQTGDTLREIALQYLGSKDRSAEVYGANRQIIGQNPDIIVEGQALQIPCGTPEAADAPDIVADGAPAAAPEPEPAPPPPRAIAAMASAAGLIDLPPETVMASAPLMPGAIAMADGPDAPTGLSDPVDARADAVSMPQAPVLLTGGPFDPFAGRGLRDGGMITRIVAAAMERGGAPAAEIVFVDDRPAHLENLLGRGAFALSFPWAWPDCGRSGLMPAEAALCSDFIASDSLYEHVTEFYARAGTPAAGITDLAGLAGLTLCRPEGYPVTDLAAAGLLPDRIALSPGPTAAECLARLDRGEADVASMDAAVARALANRSRLTNALIVLEPLTSVTRLRAIGRKGDPAAEAAIRHLNAGLSDLADSGGWFAIVDDHLNGG